MPPVEQTELKLNVARELGWKVRKTEDPATKDHWGHEPILPDGNVHATEYRWSTGKFAQTDSWQILEKHVPNYPEDRNLWPELWGKLSDRQKRTFALNVGVSISEDSHWNTDDAVKIFDLWSTDYLKLVQIWWEVVKEKAHA